MLWVSERRIAASVVEDRSKKLAVMLVEAVQARLNIVSREIGIEGYLASGIHRSAMVGGGNGHVVRRTVEIGGVVVVKRRNGQQRFRVKGVYPGKVDKRIAFMLAITESNAWVLSFKAILGDWRVLDVVRIGIIRDLVIVPAQRGHEPKLV